MKKKLSLSALLALTLFTVSCKKNIQANPEEIFSSNAKVEVLKEESNQQVISNVTIPFDQTVLVALSDASEMVHFKGQLHLLTRFSPTDPCRLFTNVISLQGIGQTSGLTYRIAGSYETMQTVSAGSTFAFEHFYFLLPPNPVLPPNPIQPGDPCRFLYSVRLDGNGAVLEASAFAFPITGVVITE